MVYNYSPGFSYTFEGFLCDTFLIVALPIAILWLKDRYNERLIRAEVARRGIFLPEARGRTRLWGLRAVGAGVLVGTHREHQLDAAR